MGAVLPPASPVPPTTVKLFWMPLEIASEEGDVPGNVALQKYPVFKMQQQQLKPAVVPTQPPSVDGVRKLKETSAEKLLRMAVSTKNADLWRDGCRLASTSAEGYILPSFMDRREMRRESA